MRIRSVEFAGTLVDPEASLPGDLPQIAFSGASNVGKSSLINRLLGRTRKGVARVSATPGKTQGLNFYRVNDEFFLVDLPGFGYAKVPERVRAAWQPLIEGYLRRSEGPLAAVHLVDVRHEPRAGDLLMLDYLAEIGLPVLVVLTKIDKLSRERRTKRIPDLINSLGVDEDQVVPFSSKTGEGREALLEAVASLLNASAIRSTEGEVGDAEP